MNKNRTLKPSVQPSSLQRVQSGAVAGHPDEAWVDRGRGWVVQIWDDEAGCRGTPWEGTKRVAVKHTSAKTPAEFDSPKHSQPITWDDLQAIKDDFWPT